MSYTNAPVLMQKVSVSASGHESTKMGGGIRHRPVSLDPRKDYQFVRVLLVPNSRTVHLPFSFTRKKS